MRAIGRWGVMRGSFTEGHLIGLYVYPAEGWLWPNAAVMGGAHGPANDERWGA